METLEPVVRSAYPVVAHRLSGRKVTDPAKIEENAVLSIPVFAYPMLFGELDLRAQIEFLVRISFKPTLYG